MFAMPGPLRETFTLYLLVTHVHQKMGKKSNQNPRAFYPSEILRSPVVLACRDIFSNVKNKLLYWITNILEKYHPKLSIKMDNKTPMSSRHRGRQDYPKTSQVSSTLEPPSRG